MGERFGIVRELEILFGFVRARGPESASRREPKGIARHRLAPLRLLEFHLLEHVDHARAKCVSGDTGARVGYFCSAAFALDQEVDSEVAFLGLFGFGETRSQCGEMGLDRAQDRRFRDVVVRASSDMEPDVHHVDGNVGLCGRCCRGRARDRRGLTRRKARCCLRHVRGRAMRRGIRSNGAWWNGVDYGCLGKWLVFAGCERGKKEDGKAIRWAWANPP